MAFGALKYKDNTGDVLPSADAFCPYVWCKKLQIILLVYESNFSPSTVLPSRPEAPLSPLVAAAWRRLWCSYSLPCAFLSTS